MGSHSPCQAVESCVGHAGALAYGAMTSDPCEGARTTLVLVEAGWGKTVAVAASGVFAAFNLSPGVTRAGPDCAHPAVKASISRNGRLRRNVRFFDIMTPSIPVRKRRRFEYLSFGSHQTSVNEGTGDSLQTFSQDRQIQKYR